MNTTFFNYDPSDILSEKIVGYDSVLVSHDKADLFAFVEVTIAHPSAPKDAVLTTLEKRFVRQFKPDDPAKATNAVYMLGHAIGNLRQLAKNPSSCF